MSSYINYCPDTHCEFWEYYPDGFRGIRCSCCSKQLVTEKPVHPEQKRRLLDSFQFNSLSAEDGDNNSDKKRMKLSYSADSIIIIPNQNKSSLHNAGESKSLPTEKHHQDEVSLHDAGQSKSIPTESTETHHQDESSLHNAGQSKPIPTESTETHHQDESSLHNAGQSKPIPTESTETHHQDESSLHNAGQSKSLSTESTETHHQDESSLHDAGQSKSIPTESTETHHQDECSLHDAGKSKSLSTESTETHHRDEGSLHDTGQSKSIPSESIQKLKQDETSIEPEQSKLNPTCSVVSLIYDSTSSNEQEDLLSGSNSTYTIKDRSVRQHSEPEENPQGIKRIRGSNDSSDHGSTLHNSSRVEDKLILQSQQINHSVLRKPEIYRPVDHDESQYVSIQFNTLIFEEYWAEIKCISIGVGNYYFDLHCIYIVPFEPTKTIQLQNGKFVIVSGTLNYPIRAISENEIRFPYKYCIYSNDNKEEFEHLHHTSNTDYNRCFIWNFNTHPIEQTPKRTYQHYDTMILPDTSKKEGGIGDWIFSLWSPRNDIRIKFNQISIRRLISLQAFLPSYLGLGHSQPCNSLEEFIIQFIALTDTLIYFQIRDPEFNHAAKNWDFKYTDAEMASLVESWIMATYTPARTTHLDSKGIILHFYLYCFLIQHYNLHNDELNMRLINLVDGSIDSILKHKSYVFDASVYTLKFIDSVITSVAEFIFKKVISSRNPAKLMTIIPIYHCISDIEGYSNTLHGELKYNDNEYWGVHKEGNISLLSGVPFDFIKKALTIAEYDQILIFTIIIYTLNDQNANRLCNYFKEVKYFPLSALMSALLFCLNSRSTRGDCNKMRMEVFRFIKMAITKEHPQLEVNDLICLIKLTLIYTTKQSIQNFTQEQFRHCLTIISRSLIFCDSKLPTNPPIAIDKFKQFFDNFVIKWIQESIIKNDLRFKNILLETKLWDEIILNYVFPPSVNWSSMVESHLLNRFNDSINVTLQYIIDLFIHIHNKGKHSALLQEVFLKELTSRLQLIKSGDKNEFVKRLYEHLSKTDQLERVNNIFSNILLKEKSNFDRNPINHFLTWTSWDTYFSFLCIDNIDKVLSENAKDMLEIASTQFVSLLEEILRFKITGVILNLIHDNKEYFLILAENILESKHSSEYSFDDICRDLEICTKMYHWAREQNALLMDFHAFLENLHNINIEDYSTFLSLNLEQTNISNICYAEGDSYLFSPSLGMNSIVTSPRFSSISNVCVSLPVSKILFQIFNLIITNKGISLQTPFDLNSFYEDIWIPAWDSCLHILKEIRNETILISDLVRYFDCSENTDAILNDLLAFNSCCKQYQGNARNKVDNSLKPCANKIKLYSKLQNCCEAANLIIKLKEVLLIKLNFEIIENMRNVKQNFQNKRLKEVNKQVSDIALNLGNFSKPNLDVIQAIIDRIEFIMWIRSNLKDLNELKTFVDISLTTCGGNPVDVDRITCLSSVCTNFAPIIFQIDENTSYETLIARCRQVIESVERNKELTKLLRQVGENVTFWEEMKKSHGSVEETTLIQLDNIIKSGEFCLRIGESLHLCDIVSLSVERENGEKRIYSLEQLREFHSKLMLVVGKSELPGLNTHTSSYENSQLFNHKLDTITEIGTIVIQLAETGNQRYLNYELFSECNQQDDGLMETKMKLRNTLEDWKVNVEQARNSHYFLNYYTISQIVFLQKGIRSFIEDREDRELEQLYHLLGLLNPDLSKQDITQALEQSDIIPKQNLSLKYNPTNSYDFSKQSLSTAISTHYSQFSLAQSRYTPTTESFSISNNIVCSFPESLSSMEKELAQKVSDEAGLPLTLVIKGINEIHKNDHAVSDVTKLLNWCIENELESDTEFMDVDAVFSFEEEIPPMIESNKEIFQIEGSIDLHQLGHFLDEIFRIYGNKIRGEREFLYNLKAGTPNLIVIPSKGMLEFVLSLYMSDNDKLPLPYYHEILICTPQTRLEEIEIFWRRAVLIPDKLNLYLFCLVEIENLSYDVAVQAVSKLKCLQQNPERGDNYKLALICSEEKEESSYMAAALDDYKIPILSRCKPESVKDYINRRLSPVHRHAIFKKSEPAWMVDRERKRVRLVVSDSVGAGKSLYINNLKSDLLSHGIVSEEEIEQSAVTVAVHGKQASEEHLAEQLLKRSVSGVKHGVMYHVDIASTVQLCLEPILFKLLILGGICKRSGELWHCRRKDYYVIEMTLSSEHVKFSPSTRLYPCSLCVQPLNVIGAFDNLSAQTIDLEQLRKEQYQRVCVYLRRLDSGEDLDNFKFNQAENIERIYQGENIHILLKHCGIKHSSWSELRNFVSFLDKQLSDCDISDYCQSGIMGQEWKGFKSFVVKFMILMSRDFATPSLKEDNVEHSPGVLSHFEIMERRRWENNSHPFIFFNPDRHTMTFLGFHISNLGHLVDSDDPSHVIETNIMHPQLLQILTINRVNLQENFSKLNKMDKIMKIAGVMGIEWIADPDPGYVLTLDNMRKILAILMRFRCNIPVVIMGETGCGKTRLIQFMCSLQALQTGATNMLILKVHGGTTETDVMRKVEEAENLAQKNYIEHQVDTVLFFDEANTSPAIGLIKEIMCDRRMYGRHIGTDIGLQFIAACNPYRKHTEKMLNKLSSAGLGFFTKSSETSDRLGDIPLRELVYRVMELPASLRPLVWDFGQLSNSIEKTYTREIVARHLRDRNSPIEARDDIIDVISDVLAGAQNYMRERKDECSFVSLRDVERAMRVMLWFYSKLDFFRIEQETSSGDSDTFSPVEGDVNYVGIGDQEVEGTITQGLTSLNGIDPITYSLIISLFVCYKARIQERDEFDKHMINIIQHPLTPIIDYQVIHREVDRCEQLLLENMTVGVNIAKNTALKENVFMMFVCIELKIPLFVIGKPGSSKSLAKSIISNSMQGSRCPDGSILQNFKQVQIMSYQCSQLSTADGIIGVFNSCRNLQRKTGSNQFTACVVLDEVGLAEDSPLLPLKVLHPLLEDSSYGSDEVECTEEPIGLSSMQFETPIDKEEDTVPIQFDYLKDHVAFIGISNWSLDPAKMNRGVMLSRGDPDIEELTASAKGICQSTSGNIQWGILKSIENKIKCLAKAYLQLTNVDMKRDYYGLRDFYGLVKMLVFFCNKYQTNLNQVILEHAVKRNFGGLSSVDPVVTFQDTVKFSLKTSKKGPDSSPLGLISANLMNLSRSFHGETRYLLLLTENYAALNILLRSPDMWPKQQDIQSIRVIFGSSFPCDQEYSAVCRNINRIKVCMESGKTVILLNLENLYESLYDALNQYYMEMNNQRYVDLGLGTHRMKCRVHNDFKLIVVADKETVQERFPTPLINRLEKHILTMSTVLTEECVKVSKQLAEWANNFIALHNNQSIGIQRMCTYTLGDCFIGFHSDTSSSIVFHVMKEMYPNGIPNDNELDQIALLERSQTLLLRMAATDAVLRVKNSHLSIQSEQIISEYFKLQLGSLEEYLSRVLSGIFGNETGAHLTLATTHSRLLTERDIDQLQQRLSTDTDSVQIRSLSLQQFQTEQQYIREIHKFLIGDSESETRERTHKRILLVQCERGAENANLIACARHKTVDELKDWREEQRGEFKCDVFLLFLVQLSREAHGSKFMSYCGGDWNTMHIDDIRSLDYTELPPISQLIEKQIYEVFAGYVMVSVWFTLFALSLCIASGPCEPIFTYPVQT